MSLSSLHLVTLSRTSCRVEARDKVVPSRRASARELRAVNASVELGASWREIATKCVRSRCLP
eukprot:scaffold41444_cov31-Tisochrysis_lutea.AAC.8